jgi:hypothetical protein
MNRFTGAVAAIILSVLVLLGGLWGLLTHFQRKAEIAALDPFSFVPADAWLVADLKNPVTLPGRTIQSTSFLYRFLEPDAMHPYREQALKLDSLLQSRPDVRNLLENSRLIVSVHPAVRGNFPVLFQLRFTQSVGRRQLENLLPWLSGDEAMQEANRFLDATIFRYGSDDDSFFYCFFKGSLLFGKNQRLVEHAITQYYSERGLDDAPGFSRLRQAAGRRSDNLFFHGARICEIISRAGRFDTMMLLPCDALPGWLAWDVVILDDEVRFTGFADTGTASPSFLNSFLNGADRPNQLPDYIPASAAAYSLAAFEEMERFAGSWSNIVADQAVPFAGGVPPGNDTPDDGQWHFDIGELGVVQMLNRGKSLDSAAVFLMHLGDSLPVPAIAERLNYLTSLELISRDTLFRDSIWHDAGGTLAWSLTRGVLPSGLPFLASKDSVLLAARSVEVLRDYLLQLGYGQTLTREGWYRQQLHFLQAASNISYYVNFPYLAAMAQDILEQDVEAFFSELDFYNYPLHRLTFQFLANQGGLFFSSGLLQRDASLLGGVPAPLWEATLDTVLHTPLFRVINHNDQSMEIIVQDQQNNLYLLDRFGNVLWKKQISGPVISEIFQVDRFRNGRLQYIFNTRNYLHLIDRNGDYVSGYPLRLPSPAVDGIAVFDYEGNRDYRVMFPGEDRRVHNFLVAGRPVRGWARPQTTRVAGGPVQYLRLDGRDYIVAIDSAGTPVFYDRRGNVRIQIRQQVSLLPSAPLFPVETPTRNFFAAPGRHGGVLEIAPNGEVTHIPMDSIPGAFGFTVLSHSASHQVKYLFATQNGISGYDMLGEKVLDIVVHDHILPEVFIARLGQRKYIGALTRETGQVLLFDMEGRLAAPFQLPGQGHFFVAALMQDQANYMVTATDDKIVCYFLGNY